MNATAISRANSIFDRAEVVPSHAKEKQWQLFRQKLPGFLSSRRPTAEELKALHWIFTSDVDLTLFDDFGEEVTSHLYVLDRPDGEQKQEQMTEAVKPLLERAKQENMSPMEFLELNRLAYQKICSTDTEIQLDPQIRGQLRSYGLRKINGGDWVRVYASHTCVIDDEMVAAFQMMSGFPPRAYYGLSVGLPEIYQALCERYDDLMDAASDFEAKLAAEAFLQLVGARVLHPFWDANGRTFMGHLAVTLEREGVPFHDYAQAQALTARLADINDQFLRQVLEQADLGFVSDIGHLNILLNHDYRQEYMGRLGKGIRRAIDRGLDKDISFYPLISDTVWQIKMFLLRNKLVKPGQAEQRPLLQQVEGKAVYIAKVPQPYREYFLDKFREAYLRMELFGKIFDANFHFLAEKNADKNSYQALEKLMRHYEPLGMEYVMAQDFSSTFLRWGEGVAIRIANDLCADEICAAIAGWPKDVSLQENIVKTMWQIARKVSEDKPGASTIRTIARTLQHPATHQLYEKYKDYCTNAPYIIIGAVSSVAGYLGSEKYGVRLAEILIKLPEKEAKKILSNMPKDRREIRKMIWKILSLPRAIAFFLP